MSLLCLALVVCGGLWCLDSISAAGAGSHRNSVVSGEGEATEQRSKVYVMAIDGRRVTATVVR